MFEVPAGGRRFRALELLVKQKRLAKTAPVPCIVGGQRRCADRRGLAGREHRARTAASAGPVPRLPGHAREGHDRGGHRGRLLRRCQGGEAAPAPGFRRARRLLEVYAEDGMTLEQLMAFTVSGDHARQEQVWDAIKELLVRRNPTRSAAC
jgi:ParB family chromosome partitioning protein